MGSAAAAAAARPAGRRGRGRGLRLGRYLDGLLGGLLSVVAGNRDSGGSSSRRSGLGGSRAVVAAAVAAIVATVIAISGVVSAGAGAGSRNTGALVEDGRNTLDHSRARNGVAVERLVDVEVLIVGIQGAGDNTLGGRAAVTLNHEVDALGVVLGLAERVKGDDLVAEDILSRGDEVGNLNLPLDTVVEQQVSTPDTVVASARSDIADLGDLEPAKLGLVGRRAAGRTTGREVVQDGTVVGNRPSVPGESEDITGLNGDGEGSGSGTAVAGHLGIGVALLGDEAVVLDGGGPTNDVGEVVAIAHSGGRVPTLVLDAIGGDDVGDVAVSGDGGGAQESSGGSGDAKRRHFVCW